MTKEQIIKITRMREKGETYASIAKAVNVSQNTVKSYCNRHNIIIGGNTAQQEYEITKCEQCGAEVVQNLKGKHKRFCCDVCRNTWWNHHPDLVNRKAVYDHICRHCGKAFRAYGNARRKYCSHECYIAERFGGGHDEQ